MVDVEDALLEGVWGDDLDTLVTRANKKTVFVDFEAWPLP